MTLAERSEIAGLANLRRTLGRQFARALYYRQADRQNELRGALAKIRRSILVRQEFENDDLCREHLTIEDLLKRFS